MPRSRIYNQKQSESLLGSLIGAGGASIVIVGAGFLTYVGVRAIAIQSLVIKGSRSAPRPPRVLYGISAVMAGLALVLCSVTLILIWVLKIWRKRFPEWTRVLPWIFGAASGVLWFIANR